MLVPIQNIPKLIHYKQIYLLINTGLILRMKFGHNFLKQITFQYFVALLVSMHNNWIKLLSVVTVANQHGYSTQKKSLTVFYRETRRLYCIVSPDFYVNLA